MRSPLVGNFHRPPASTLLSHLPSGTLLHLVDESENPYDAEAIAVYLDPAAIPESQYPALREALPASGGDLDEVLAGDPIQLGYIAKSGGKPLIRARETNPDLVGNSEFREAIAKLPGGFSEALASLSFSPEGKPELTLTLPEGIS